MIRKIIIISLSLILLFIYGKIINAQQTSSKLDGKILLQVESVGQAWYVNPADGKRHYLGHPADAFKVMRELGLGVSEADFNSFKDKAPLRLAGRILLRVEASGEAYYVEPSQLALHYLGRPTDALAIMRELGLGISDSDLAAVPIVASDTVTSDADLEGVKAYIAEDILGPDSKVKIKDVGREGEFYRVTLTLSGGQALVFYLAKNDGNYKPAVMDMAALEDKIGSKPEVMVELFVMSYCPYGLQIEKGILPVLDTLGNKIDFKLEFVDYAMHGQIELDEELRQYCIRENEPAKLTDYLNCFVAAGDSGACLDNIGIDPAGLETCLNQADNQYQVTEKYNNPATWLSGRYPVFDIDKEYVIKYGVLGSPTLVINGKTAISSRDPASLLTTICSYFKDQPEECAAELSSTVPAPGFGSGSGSGSGSCGS